ncbi:hypothetical protein OTU49_012370 [Cherax quadricarinatus]|uniref:Uncharacterized protein n=1 Tax=Cherax quadricarinatus TaxID=27406 RepID=A0AAW0VZG6_CHEQU
MVGPVGESKRCITTIPCFAISLCFSLFSFFFSLSPSLSLPSLFPPSLSLLHFPNSLYPSIPYSSYPPSVLALPYLPSLFSPSTPTSSLLRNINMIYIKQ